MSFTDYATVVADSGSVLQTQMAQRIKDGWQPFGQPLLVTPNLSRSFQIMQVVVKGTGGGDGSSASVDTLEGVTDTGKALMKAADAAAGRTAIGAGTSSLKVGNAATDAKAGNYAPKSTDISDATDIGKKILVAADAAAVKTLLGIS
ncbi:DUF1737 domain-containing protein [Pantoea stewartii]|nr:DUF1737 domain-containing protein [Pantoea stewartii]KAB0545381.1 DUF1737 domain-containing protein [Pantoea stewartii subsp. stewartii]